jgi:two-component system sensor histidine kinase HydH
VRPPPPLRAALDRDLVRAALESLVRNAREAMADRRGGRIDLVLEVRGRALTIRVEDDGPGMDARTRERAFDAFYTTKATASGLGLALVARVARAHGGSVSIRERQGGGTVIELRFPRAHISA